MHALMGPGMRQPVAAATAPVTENEALDEAAVAAVVRLSGLSPYSPFLSFPISGMVCLDAAGR